MFNMTALRMILKKAEKRKINVPEKTAVQNDLLKLKETRPV